MARSVLVYFVIVCCFRQFTVNSLANSVGRDCSVMENIVNCNECIRCGGHWCNIPLEGLARCVSEPLVNWCPEEREMLEFLEETSIPGDIITPIYSEKNARIGVPNLASVVYTSTTELKTNLISEQTTQTFHVSLNSRTKCSSGQCNVTVEFTPDKDFCSDRGRTTESIIVKLSVGNLNEQANIKYNVPCACECSQLVERNSKKCNFQGDYSCGVCSCKDGWSGEFCTEKICEHIRGDLYCAALDNSLDSTMECSGNGYCGPCETCVCYTDRPGWQYFDRDNCADICQTTNQCDSCLRSPDLGAPCRDCPHSLYFQPLNTTALTAFDEFDRQVWVTCNATLFGECYVEYAASRYNDDTIVMIISHCDEPAKAAVFTAVKITIPVVLGVLAVVAATAAAVGYMVFKSRSPQLPLNDPQYQNIGAEDCVGENPLYKPPTSSFKNPTYGKW